MIYLLLVESGAEAAAVLAHELRARGHETYVWHTHEPPPALSTAPDVTVECGDWKPHRYAGRAARRLWWTPVPTTPRDSTYTDLVVLALDALHVDAVLGALERRKRPEPTPAPLPPPPVGEGVLSELPPLAYVGRVNCVTGYGAAARHQIWMLRAHGARLRVEDAGSVAEPDPSGTDPFVQACRASSPGTAEVAGTIIHLAPNCVGPFTSFPRPHVLVSVWETSRLPKTWVGATNCFDQVWCPTRWQAEVYLDSGVDEKRIRVVPFALDPALYPAAGPGLAEVEALRAKGYFVFGSVFQWTERKAPQALIGGFLQAFQERERVALVLKTYTGDDPHAGVQRAVDEIVASYRTTGQHPKVLVVSRRLSRTEMVGFYRSIQCYVSTHRGEGWGLPIHEALLMRRPVIATDWSAPAEFAAGHYMPVDYHLEAPFGMDWQPFYTLDQQWAVPHVDSYVAALRAAYVGSTTCDALVGHQAAPLETLMAMAGEAASKALGELL